MSRPRMLIIKTGNAVPSVRGEHGDFEHWFERAPGFDGFTCRTVEVHHDRSLPSPDGLAGALITGSPAMVSSRHAWSERTARWLVDAHQRGLPLLGVCYGHQLLAHALGGRVGSNPQGRAMGTRRCRLSADGDALLGGFDSPTYFHVTHCEAVLAPPPAARVLARAEHDGCHALHFGGLSWGVQFHPEFDQAIMTGYIRARSDALADEGLDAARLLAGIRPAPDGPRVLERFAELCRAPATVGA